MTNVDRDESCPILTIHLRFATKQNINVIVYSNVESQFGTNAGYLQPNNLVIQRHVKCPTCF